MGLSAQEAARCPVELSESEFFHYHDSNIDKILEDMCDRFPADSSSKVLSAAVMALLEPFFSQPRRLSNGMPHYAFTSDTTKLVKPLAVPQGPRLLAHGEQKRGIRYIQSHL